MPEKMIPLAEAIGALRAELAAAKAAAVGEDLTFSIGPIELEFNLAVESKDDASGKIEFKIFGIGASGGGGRSVTDSASHKVKLVLTPATHLQVGDTR